MGGGGGVREGRRKTRMRLMIYTLATVYYCLEPVRGYHLLVSFFLFFFFLLFLLLVVIVFVFVPACSLCFSLSPFGISYVRDLPYFSRNDVESRIFGREKNSTRVWFFRVKIAPLAGERKRKYTRPFFLKMHGAEKYVGFGYETLCISIRAPSQVSRDRSPRIMIEIKVKKRKEKKRERRKVSLGSRGYRVAYLH